MKRLSLIVLGLALLAASGCGDTPEDTAEVAMEPAPLLDRELFFGDPKISGSQLSPDGKWMSFIKPYEGTRNIWVKAADAPFDSAKPVTADDRPVPGYFWSRDSAYILYVQDKDGDENFHVWAVDPAGEAADKGVPAARNLTPVDGVRALGRSSHPRLRDPPAIWHQCARHPPLQQRRGPSDPRAAASRVRHLPRRHAASGGRRGRRQPLRS